MNQSELLTVLFYTFLLYNNLIIFSIVKIISTYFEQTRTGQPVGLVSQLNQLEAEFRDKIENIKTFNSII